MGEVVYLFPEVVHLVEKNDPDWDPLCGTHDASLQVADRMGPLAPGKVWCAKCLEVQKKATK